MRHGFCRVWYTYKVHIDGTSSPTELPSVVSPVMLARVAKAFAKLRPLCISRLSLTISSTPLSRARSFASQFCIVENCTLCEIYALHFNDAQTEKLLGTVYQENPSLKQLTQVHFWRCGKAKGFGDFCQIKGLYVKDPLQLMAVVSSDVILKRLFRR